MTNLWKAVALAALGALGLVAGASAPADWKPWPTTTTTQTSTGGRYTTTVSTTPVPPTSTGSVQIVAPLNRTPYTRGSTSTAVGDIRSETGGVICSISFGDGAPPNLVPAFQVGP